MGSTFDSGRMNRIAIIEFVLAFLATQADFMRSILGTVKLTVEQWSFGLIAAVALLFAWELGKFIARRTAVQGQESEGELPDGQGGRPQQASTA